MVKPVFLGRWLLAILLPWVAWSQDWADDEFMEKVQRENDEEKEGVSKPRQILGGFINTKKKEEIIDTIRADQAENLRVACRTAISGRLLTLRNDLLAYKYHRDALSREARTLVIEEKKAYDEHRKAKARFEASQFEVSLAERERRIYYRLELLRQQIKENAKAMTGVEGDIGQTSDTYHALLSSAEKVFKISFVQMDDDRSILNVDYRSPCPPFRAVCPLPPSHAKTLRLLAPANDSRYSCVRYAQIADPKAMRERYLKAKAQ